METGALLSILEFDQPFMVSIPGGKQEGLAPIIPIDGEPTSAPPVDRFPSILMPPPERGVIKTSRYDFF